MQVILVLRIRQVKIPITSDNEKFIMKKIASKLNVSSSAICSYKIVKKSIDARDKNNIFYVYEFDILTSCESSILKKNKSVDIFVSPKEEYELNVTGSDKLDDKIVIVGAGPAGLLCAYLLSEVGFKPLVIEQGEKVEDRVKTIEQFFETNELNPLSNIQFGEGGAGTFSDGKLTSGINNLNCRKVLSDFVKFGAPEEIEYVNKPHIGTDKLVEVVKNIREYLISHALELLKKNVPSEDVVEEVTVEEAVSSEVESE